MIIGFMGKGGSGKTTLSYRFIRFLEQHNKQILAIDADHNMDLIFNLGVKTSFPYLGDALSSVRMEAGLTEKQAVSEALFQATPPIFCLKPPDAFTSAFSLAVNPRLRVMAAGPHTEQVMYGEACSHVLNTPLKIYLPLLRLGHDEVVILDQTAGMDAVGSGIPTGFDFTFVCAEATPHGLKVAKQIGDSLAFYGAPFAYVLNKASSDEDLVTAKIVLGEIPAYAFHRHPNYFDPKTPTHINDTAVFDRMHTHVSTYLMTHGNQRLERSKQKFERNHQYKEQKHTAPHG